MEKEPGWGAAVGAAPAAGRAGICSVGQGVGSDTVKGICGPGDIGLEA